MGKSEKAIIMSGYGINSEMETQEVLRRVGLESDIVHVNDLIDKRKRLADYRLLVFPGGFSYGDDAGAGTAFANRVRNNLLEPLNEFLDGDNLVLGICNGFQILVHLGLLPGFKRFKPEAALMQNASGVFQCRFVTLKPVASSIASKTWTKGIERIYCPVAHGEGNFFCKKGTLEKMRERGMVAFRYVKPDKDMSPAEQEFPYNPNGAIDDIAGITSENGKVLGMMPHPERAMDFCNIYDWTLQKEILTRQGRPLPKESINMQIFRNVADCFK